MRTRLILGSCLLPTSFARSGRRAGSAWAWLRSPGGTGLTYGRVDVEQLVRRIERTGLGRALDRLGPLSPLATLRTYTPGAQALLTGIEVAAEQGLHVARAILTVGLVAVFWVTGLIDAIPAAYQVAGLVLFCGIWGGLFLALRRAQRIPILAKVGLGLVDTFLASRGAFAATSPLFDETGAGLLVTRTDIALITVGLLTIAVLSGAFRLEPVAVLVSAAVAIGLVLAVAPALAMTPFQLAGSIAMLVFTAIVGGNSARAFRHLALRAREQAVLQRYVPEALTRELARVGGDLGSGVEVDITVLIVDIRGYTQRSERLTPGEAVAFLNRYFEVVVGPLARHGAVLDKYIGDGVFTFFQGEAHRARALRAGREVLEAVARAGSDWSGGAGPLRIGVAIHTGRALVGSIGSEHKREYTAIADTVNVSSRLEELNKSLGAEMVVSEEALADTAAEDRRGLVGPTSHALRGHDAHVTVFHLPAGYTGAALDRESVGASGGDSR